MGQVLCKIKWPLCNINIFGFQWLRPRPHKSGLKPHIYIFFNTNRPPVHTKPVNTDTESALF